MKNWLKLVLVLVQLAIWILGVSSLKAQSLSNLRVIGNPLGFCPGQTYTFLFDTLGPIGPSTFQIQVSNSSGSFSSPIASASGSSISINLLIPNSAASSANYAFRVIRTSPILLVSDTLKNKLISKPSPGFSFSPNAACPDNDVTFTNSSTGNGSLSYAWNFARTYTYGAPVASSIANPVVRFNPFYGGATVSYEVQLVVTDAYGCKDSSSQNVSVKQRPLAQLGDSNVFSSPPFSNCQGSPSASNPQFRLTVDNQCQVQNTIASISINWGEGTPQSLPGTFTQASHVYSALGAYNLEVTATNNNGCISTQSYAVSNQINPTLLLSGPANKQGCAPFLYPIVMSNHHSNSGGTYYVFDFDDGSPLLRIDTLGSDTVWHTFINNSCSKPGGAYIVKAKAYNLCDSTPASLGNFRIYSKPRAGFSLGSDTIICASSSITPINTTQSVQYGLSCATTTNYQWTFTGGVPATSTAATPPSVSYALPGNYPIRLIASNPCGNDTFIKTICVQAAPTANFLFTQVPTSKCVENVLNLNNTSSTLTQCLPGQFLWEVRDSASNTLINPGLKFIYLAGNADTLEPTLKFLQAGKYRLRLKVINACGVHTKDSVLTIKDIPKVILPVSQTYCDTTQIEFNGLQTNHVANYDSSFGSLTAFSWAISPSSFAFVSGNASSKSPKIKLFGNGVGSLDYQIIHTAQNECGVSLADTQLVSINAQPHTIASATDTMICSGASTSISLSSSLPSGVTYTWRAFASSPNLSGYSSQATGVTGPINQVINLVGNSVEFVTYRIVARHAATNCIGDSVDIRIYLQTPIGNNSITGGAAYCIGGASPTLIGQVPSGGNGFYGFQWQKWNGSSWVNTGVSDTLKDYTPPILVQTEYYRRQVTSGWCNGSLGSFSNIDTVIIYPKPIVNAGLDFYKCKNETNFKLQGNPTGGSWFGTHVYAGDSFNLTAASAGVYPLIYSYTSANSCSNTDTVNLRVFSFPTVYAGSNFSICEGPDSALLTGFTPAGGTWLGPGITATNYFRPAVTGAGLFNLVYQYNDTNGCVGRDTLQVRVFAKPNPNFALQTQYCPKDTQTLFSVHNFSSTITSYTWQVSNLGGFSNTILSSFSIPNPLVSLPENQGNSDINYSLKLLVMSADGCKDSITKNTLLRRRPDAQFSIGSVGNCGPLNLSLSNATNNVSSRWQWTVLLNSGVLVQTDTSQNPTVFLPENLSSASINYQVKLVAFRNDLTLSCSDTNTQFITLYPRPNADFSINPLDSGCGPFSASFINLSDPKNSESITSMYFNWDFGVMGNDTTKNASRVYTNIGVVDSVYEVNLIAASAWGCKDTATKQVNVKPNAKASFSTGITVSCAPFSINSSSVSAQDFPAANGVYSWYANGVLLGTGITFPGYVLANPSDSVEIKLKVQSKNGCLADSVSQKYFTIENPRPNFYAVDSIACSGSTIDLINTSVPLSGLNYRWELGSSSSVSTTLNSQLTVKNYGILDTLIVVKLVGIAGGSGCLDSLSKSIVVKPLPKVNFALSDTLACYPKTILASNTSGVIPAINNLSYKWSLLETGASLSNDTSAIQTLVSFADNQRGFSDFYTLKLKVASDFGCWDSLTKSIRIPTRPIANFTFVSDSFCGGINFNASNTSEYASTYLWGSTHAAVSFNNVNLFEPNLSFASHNGLQDSIYSIQLIASTADNCYDTNEVIVKVFPLPTCSFYTNLDSGCARFDAVIKTNAIVKTPATYLWNLGDGNQITSVQDSVVHGYLGAQNKDTSYSIQLITVSENGCKDTLVQTNFIKVLGEPKSVFSTNVDTSCSPIGLYVLNQSYGSPQNYLWDFGNGETSNLAEPVNLPIVYSAYDSITTFVIKLAVSNLCGVDTSEKYLTVLPDLVQAKFNTSAKLGCESLRVVFTDNSTAGENISWDFGDGFTSSNRNPIHTYSAPGTYLAKQYVSNTCNYDTASMVITVYPKPNFSLNPIANPICQKNAIQFGVQLVDSGSIVWHFGDGDSSTSYGPKHKYLGSGKFVYEAIVTSNYSNCSNTIMDSLFVLPLPSVSILVDTNRGCLGQAFQYSLNSNGNHYYSWDFGDSSYAVGETVAPHFYSSSGTYLVKLLGTSVEGCQDSSVLPIMVWPNPIAQFDYTPKDTCAGPSWVRFTNLSIGANAYHWDFGNGNTSTALNGYEYYQGLAKYPIQLIATNTFYCSDTLVQTFEILDKPIAFFSFTDSSGCLPYQVDFTNSSIGGSKYVWYFGDGNESTDKNPSHVYTTPGIYYVSLVLQPGNVCNDSFTHPRPIKIDEKVGLTFTHELIEDKKPYREVIFTTSAFNNYNYVWEFGDGTKGFGESTFHRYAEKDSGCFNVVMFVNTSNNCDTSFIDSICLPSYWEGLYVPNAFTPDYGSEEVRVFKPAGVELISYHIKIYNKWGELVWESNGLQNGSPAEGWNGVDLNGIPCMAGTYIWSIEAAFSSGKTWDGMEQKKDNFYRRGSLNLIR